MDWKASFYFYGGKIIGNTVKSQGGGLRLEWGHVYIYPKGSHPSANGNFLIAGEDHENPNYAERDPKQTDDLKAGNSGHAYSRWQDYNAWQTTIDDSTIADVAKDKNMTFTKTTDADNNTVYLDSKPNL
jgi:hypothetical protein